MRLSSCHISCHGIIYHVWHSKPTRPSSSIQYTGLPSRIVYVTCVALCDLHNPHDLHPKPSTLDPPLLALVMNDVSESICKNQKQMHFIQHETHILHDVYMHIHVSTELAHHFIYKYKCTYTRDIFLWTWNLYFVLKCIRIYSFSVGFFFLQDVRTVKTLLGRAAYNTVIEVVNEIITWGELTKTRTDEVGNEWQTLNGTSSQLHKSEGTNRTSDQRPVVLLNQIHRLVASRHVTYGVMGHVTWVTFNTNKAFHQNTVNGTS